MLVICNSLTEGRSGRVVQGVGCDAADAGSIPRSRAAFLAAGSRRLSRISTGAMAMGDRDRTRKFCQKHKHVFPPYRSNKSTVPPSTQWLYCRGLINKKIVLTCLGIYWQNCIGPCTSFVPMHFLLPKRPMTTKIPKQWRKRQRINIYILDIGWKRVSERKRKAKHGRNSRRRFETLGARRFN